MHRRTPLTLLAALALSCGGGTAPTNDPLTEPCEVVETPTPEAAEIRNVILFIGDGMGPQQMGLLEQYALLAPSSTYDGDTAMRRMMNAGDLGLSLTGPADALVVDSACSATQLASGVSAPGEALGVDVDGSPVSSVLEVARGRGWATGLVTDTRLTHATPAAFVSHRAHRSMEYDIAGDFINARVDVLLSGGLRYFAGAHIMEDETALAELTERVGGAFEPTSRRSDERDLLAEADAAGYQLVFDAAQLQAADGAAPLLGLFSNSSMMNGIQESQMRAEVEAGTLAAEERQPMLREMVEAALSALEQDEDGFFLMVEAGQIDWAGHQNDAGRMLHEMIRMDYALDAILEWAEGRDDTLIILTADHETGNFGFSYHRAELPDAQVIPGGVFEEYPYQPNFNFAPFDVLDGLYAQQMTYGDMMWGFLDAEDQSPEALVALVNANTSFPITVEDAEAILADEPNAYQVEGHGYLEAETWPEVHDFEAFYVYGEDTRSPLLARAVAEQQAVVWGTGTHTATPVAVVSWGPVETTSAFTGMMHHTDVGAALVDIVTP